MPISSTARKSQYIMIIPQEAGPQDYLKWHIILQLPHITKYYTRTHKFSHQLLLINACQLRLTYQYISQPTSCTASI
jgi:hypothetical protein